MKLISRQLVYAYARTREFVGGDKTSSKRVRMFNWSYYQPTIVIPAQPYTAVVEWRSRRGPVNRQGIIFSSDPNVAVEVGAQFWLLGQSRKIGTVPGPHDSMEQAAIG